MATTTPADLDVDRLVTGFVHVLRRGGMSITISQSTLFRAALDVVGLSEGLDVYWAGRSTLVLKQEHVAMYDAMFLAFFHHNTSGFSMRFDDVAELMDQLASDDGDDSGGDGGGDEETEVLRFSRTERLHEKDFGDFDEAELREAERAMAELRVRPAMRRSRRRRRSNHGDAHDLRRTVRAAMRRGGEPIDLLTTETGDRNRRLVLLLDISGSMETYAKVLIRFAHAAVVGRGDVEVFALGTRLTRITRQLATRDPEIAVAAAACSRLAAPASAARSDRRRSSLTKTTDASALARPASLDSHSAASRRVESLLGRFRASRCATLDASARRGTAASAAASPTTLHPATTRIASRTTLAKSRHSPSARGRLAVSAAIAASAAVLVAGGSWWNRNVINAAAASEVTEPGPPRRMSRLNRLVSPQAMEEANARSTSKQSVAKAASRSPPAP